MSADLNDLLSSKWGWIVFLVNLDQSDTTATYRAIMTTKWRSTKWLKLHVEFIITEADSIGGRHIT